jgi:hypothetical protein
MFGLEGFMNRPAANRDRISADFDFSTSPLGQYVDWLKGISKASSLSSA